MDPARAPEDAPDAASIERAGGPSPLLLLAGVAAVVAIGLAMFLVLGLEGVRHLVLAAWAQLQVAPAPLYFGFMSVAIAAPVPVSVLYVTAGPIYGVTESLLWIAPALALNSLLVHAIGDTALRPWLQAFVDRRGATLPRLEARTALRGRRHSGGTS